MYGSDEKKMTKKNNKIITTLIIRIPKKNVMCVAANTDFCRR